MERTGQKSVLFFAIITGTPFSNLSHLECLRIKVVQTQTYITLKHYLMPNFLVTFVVPV